MSSSWSAGDVQGTTSLHPKSIGSIANEILHGCKDVVRCAVCGVFHRDTRHKFTGILWCGRLLGVPTDVIQLASIQCLLHGQHSACLGKDKISFVADCTEHHSLYHACLITCLGRLTHRLNLVSTATAHCMQYCTRN